MRLITRSDFDGLACGALLKEAGVIDHWKFAHPKDLQDGLIDVGPDDCLANVPYVPGCGLWFDHHSSERERLELSGQFNGVSRQSPSCAHIIYDYYGGAERFPNAGQLLNAVDRMDSADLTPEEVLHPQGWVLLGFIMDPRTGLGRWRSFRISNYQLMELLLECCLEMSIDEILELPDVKERVEVYFDQNDKFIEMVRENTVVDGDVIISDLRDVDPIYSGNRFLIYSLYPEQSLSVWIVSGKGGRGCSCAVGHSVLNRNSKVDVGSLMLKYGGGGHFRVGTCQFTDRIMDREIQNMLADLRALNGPEPAGDE